MCLIAKYIFDQETKWADCLSLFAWKTLQSSLTFQSLNVTGKVTVPQNVLNYSLEGALYRLWLNQPHTCIR